MAFRIIDHMKLRDDLETGMNDLELKAIRALPVAPAWTVGEYVDYLKYRGRIVEENGIHRLVPRSVVRGGY